MTVASAASRSILLRRDRSWLLRDGLSGSRIPWRWAMRVRNHDSIGSRDEFLTCPALLGAAGGVPPGEAAIHPVIISSTCGKNKYSI